MCEREYVSERERQGYKEKRKEEEERGSCEERQRAGMESPHITTTKVTNNKQDSYVFFSYFIY